MTCSVSRTSFKFLGLVSTIRISSFARTHRKGERERRAHAHPAFPPVPPAMELDELAAESQPQSGAFRLLLRRAHLAELLEHRLLVLWSDTHPSVSYRDLSHAVHRPRPHLHPAPLGRELDRIRQQVQDDLSDFPLVGLDLTELGVHSSVQSDAPSPSTLADQHQGVVDRLR